MRREHNHWSSSFDFANTNDKLILLLNNAHILIQPLRVILALVQMKYPLLNINSNSGPIELRRVDTGPWDRHIGEIGPFKFRPLQTKDESRKQINLQPLWCESSELEREGITLSCSDDTCVSEMNEEDLKGRNAGYLSNAAYRKIILKVLPTKPVLGQEFNLSIQTIAKEGKAMSYTGEKESNEFFRFIRWARK